MQPKRRLFPQVPNGAFAGLLVLMFALLAACSPGTSLPTQGPAAAASSPEPTPSTPEASASTGGSVVPVINF